MGRSPVNTPYRQRAVFSWPRLDRDRCRIDTISALASLRGRRVFRRVPWNAWHDCETRKTVNDKHVSSVQFDAGVETPGAGLYEKYELFSRKRYVFILYERARGRE